MSRARQLWGNKAPSSRIWEARRQIYIGLERDASLLVTKATRTPYGGPFESRFVIPERELELCFCTGAWLACLMLSMSIIERVEQHHLGDDREIFTRWVKDDTYRAGRKLRNAGSHLANRDVDDLYDKYFINHALLRRMSKNCVFRAFFALHLVAGKKLNAA